MTSPLPEGLPGVTEPKRGILMHEATRAHIRQLLAEIADRQEEVRRFETRYGMSLARKHSAPEERHALDGWRRRLQTVDRKLLAVWPALGRYYWETVITFER